MKVIEQNLKASCDSQSPHSAIDGLAVTALWEVISQITQGPEIMKIYED